MNKEDIKLLPCPFCNSNASLKESEGISDYDYGKIYYDVYCNNKDCYLQDGADWKFSTIDEAVNMWNTRSNKNIRLYKYDKLLDNE